MLMTFLTSFLVKANIGLANNSKSACLLEPSTLDVLYEKNSDSKLFPASMTKIMSIKIILDHYTKGSFTMDDMVTTSDYASSMGGSQIFLSIGEKMSVGDLLKSVIIASANDACVALSEFVAGSEESFVELMNKEVEKMGLTNTHFANCTGLPIDNHYTSSYDMAVIASHLLNNYGDIVLPISSKYEDFVREGTEKQFWLVNTNKLIRYMDGIDGLKTGWTEKAGYCLTATMKKNGMRLIAVSMGCESPKKRNSDIVELLNYGMSNYELVTLFKKGDVVKELENINTTPNIYHLILDKDVNLLKKKNVGLGNITSEVVDQKFRIYLDNELYKEVDLIVSEKLMKSSFLEIFFNLIKQMFG
jgi:D-alanyl-D-alanine carboxypeptidase (penicillin-binding protein 5/6)